MFGSRASYFKILTLLVLVGWLPFHAQPARGQGVAPLTLYQPEVDFGRTITFRAQVNAGQSVQQVNLLFRGETQQNTNIQPLTPSADGALAFTYDASLNLIPPFSKVFYWFEATLPNGQVVPSAQGEFIYEDTRFPWNKLTSANVTIHWYAGDIASLARDMAGLTMLKMSDLFPVSLEEPINIYIYSNIQDLQATLALGGKDWAGGHAIPSTGVALVAIDPEAQDNEIMAKIPHEMAHVLLYRALGGAKYDRQPRWLVEGLATTMEQYADPEFERVLRAASERDTLIPFAKLCDNFPLDAGSAYLAYAQSQSFVKHLYAQYGKSGMQRLMDEYGDGITCELGATRALGAPLSQLDLRWRENVLGQNVTGVAVRNLAPYMLIMALILIVPLWGLIDLLRQRRKREEQYAPKPNVK